MVSGVVVPDVRLSELAYPMHNSIRTMCYGRALFPPECQERPSLLWLHPPTQDKVEEDASRDEDYDCIKAPRQRLVFKPLLVPFGAIGVASVRHCTHAQTERRGGGAQGAAGTTPPQTVLRRVQAQ